MNYDKNSFLAGLATGRQLKGWGTSPAGGGAADGLDELLDGTITSITSGASVLRPYALYGCEFLEYLSLPNVTKVGLAACRGCTALKEVLLPSAVTITNSTSFYNCSAIQKADVGQLDTFPDNLFRDCSELTTLIFRKSDGVVSRSLAFTPLYGTPIASGTGYIYVPAALVDLYKVSVWSTLAAQIRAIEDYPEICG